MYHQSPSPSRTLLVVRIPSARISFLMAPRMRVYVSLAPGGPEDVGAVQELGGVLGEEPRLSGRLHQPLEQGALETALKQFASETAQDRRIETLLFKSRARERASI